MKIELETKLVKKYPKIFSEYRGDPQKTCMAFGMECGDGWYWLIDSLCESMQGYINANKKPQVVAAQVKEKFGGLRFYTDGSNELIEGMIWLAEHQSYKICEDCGSTEEVSQSKGSWIYTKCKECSK